MGDRSAKNSIDRLERFHSLLAGQYWTSTDSIPEEGIVAGGYTAHYVFALR